MPTPVQILINARNAAGPAFAQLQQQLGGADRAARTLSGGMSSMLGVLAGGAALTAIIGVGRELQQLGIQSANTEQAFRELASGAGASADNMLGALRTASRGMITDLDLMTNANRAMMLGVTSNANEMAALLEVAASRGRALGRSTADAFTDIVTGIGRMSPLILDNLGIVTGGEKAFDAYAETLGKTAAQLTDVERKQFLVNKVLSDTNVQAAAASDGVAKLGVALDNYKASLGQAFAGTTIGTGIAEFVQGMADALSMENKIQAAMSDAGIGLVDKIRIEWGMLEGPAADLYQKLDSIREAVKAGTMEMPAAIAAVKNLGYAYSGAAASATGFMNSVLRSSAVVAQTGSISVAPVQTAYQRLGDAAGVTSDRLREMPPTIKASETAFRGAAGAALSYNSELEALKSSIEGIISASVSGTKSLVDFDTATGGFDANGPARDFGRMWDVAVNGFKSQWIDELRAQGLIPDDVLAAGEAALKQFAESKARAFQAGTDLGLLDVGAVTAQVREQIAANAEMERMKASILATLSGQGVNRADAQRALGQVLGDGAAAGATVGSDIALGIPQGLNTAGGQIATALKQSIADASDRILEAGKLIGRGLGDGLLQVFRDNVPAELVNILADLVAPEVLKRLNAQKTTTGARP